MKVRMLSVIVGGTLLCPTVARAQAADRTMTVFVTAAAVADVGKIDKATETRLLDAIKAARQTRKDLEKGSRRSTARSARPGRRRSRIRCTPPRKPRPLPTPTGPTGR